MMNSQECIHNQRLIPKARGNHIEGRQPPEITASLYNKYNRHSIECGMSFLNFMDFKETIPAQGAEGQFLCYKHPKG